MEKVASKSKRFRCCRLLAALALLCASAQIHARPPTGNELRAMTVKPTADYFFTAQECCYSLSIPNVAPARIQIELSPLPSGVQFLSSKKEEYFKSETSEQGTLIQFWFSFSEPGTITLPPLTLTFARRHFPISFESCIVYANPATLVPQVEVVFSDATNEALTRDKNGYFHLTEGTNVEFQLNIRYCVQIVNLSWTLPKNAIFTEKARTETANGAFLGKAFSPETTEVATYSWTPLAEGNYKLPAITLETIGYNGNRKTIALPPYIFAVEKQHSRAPKPQMQPLSFELFSQAFASPQEELPPQTEAPSANPDWATLARLRSAERHAFPWHAQKAARKAYERTFALSSDSNEAHAPLAPLSFALLALFVTLTIVLLVQHYFRKAVASGILALFFLITSIQMAAQLSPRYAIFAGGDVYTIPEEKNTSSYTEKAGQRVRILAEAGDWLYISTHEGTGWVQSTTVYAIK